MVLANGCCLSKVEEARSVLALWRESKLSMCWEKRGLVLRLMLLFRFVVRKYNKCEVKARVANKTACL